MPPFDAFRGKRALVTGCTGFKGSWLSLWLSELGASVSGVGLGLPTQPAMFEALKLRSHVDYHQGDVRDLSWISGVVEAVRPELVFHLAAQSIVQLSYDDPAGTFATNVMGTAHVLEALRRCDREAAAVIVTSDKCYDNVEWVYGYRETDRLGGKDPYSASKGAAELVARGWFHSYFAGDGSPIRLVTARAGNVVGGGDWAPARIVPDCIRAWSESRPVQIRRPRATRPWQHVLEPLSGYLTAAERLLDDRSLSGEAFNFGPRAESSYSVLELLAALGNHWDFGNQTERFLVDGSTHFEEAMVLKLNCDKASTLLGWRPVLEFADTARLTASWYDRFYHGDVSSLVAFTRGQIREFAALAANGTAVEAS
jgi:CDP-glucose 4,6-dehydratase